MVPQITAPFPPYAGIDSREQVAATAQQVRTLSMLSQAAVDMQMQLDAVKADMIAAVETIAIMARNVPGISAEQKYAYLCEHESLNETDRIAIWAILSPHTSRPTEFDS